MHPRTKRLLIPYVPTLLPDELLYSWLGRLVAYNALGDPRAYLELLFGTKDVIPGIDLPTLLEALHRRLGCFSPCNSADDLIDTTTVYPYHRPFLTIERHQAVRQILLFGGGKGLKTLLGRVANRFGANPPLRYCVACIEDDVARYGAPCWHISHQLPSVSCCSAHGFDLILFALPDMFIDKQRICLSPAALNYSHPLVRSDPFQIRFAELSAALLGAQLPVLEPSLRTEAYRTAATALGFRTRANFIDHDALATAVRNYYSDFGGFVHKDRLLSTQAHPLGWLRTLIDRPLRSAHPICHLLLIGFLFETIDGFRKAISSARDASAPADGTQESELNLKPVESAAAHHNRLLKDASISCRKVAHTLHLSVTTVVSRRRAIGIPIAERRKVIFPDRLRAIVHSLATGQSPRSIARHHRVSIGTVYRVRSQSPEILRLGKEVQQRRERDKRRARWQHAVDRHHRTSLKAVRSAVASTYTWLYRHDRVWLQNACKGLQAPSKRKPRVDWAKRDHVLCRRLKQKVDSLRDEKDRPRMSKTLLLRGLGEAMILTNITRLPRLSAYLEKIIESPLSFQFFRIDRAIEQLVTQGQQVKLWRIQRMAGVRVWTEPLREHANRTISLVCDKIRNG